MQQSHEDLIKRLIGFSTQRPTHLESPEPSDVALLLDGYASPSASVRFYAVLPSEGIYPSDELEEALRGIVESDGDLLVRAAASRLLSSLLRSSTPPVDHNVAAYDPETGEELYDSATAAETDEFWLRDDHYSAVEQYISNSAAKKPELVEQFLTGKRWRLAEISFPEISESSTDETIHNDPYGDWEVGGP